MSKRIRFTLRLSDELNKALEVLAKEEESSKNRMIVLACKELIKDYEAKQEERRS